MTAWATPEDVQLRTGKVVSEADIVLAQNIVDDYAGIDSDTVEVALIWAKDAKRLLKATVYQAAFMASQVDITGRQDVKGVAQDGVSATFAYDGSVVLAPLARRSITQLSWKRPRPLRGRGRGGAMGILELATAWPRDAERPAAGWQGF
jgi:hypothetical protein